MNSLDLSHNVYVKCGLLRIGSFQTRKQLEVGQYGLMSITITCLIPVTDWAHNVHSVLFEQS